MGRKVIIVALLLCSVAWAQGGIKAYGVKIDRQYRAVLSWGTSPSPGVTYNVYRNGVKINTSAISALTYTDANVTHKQTYTYTVRSYDPVAQLESADSTPIVATIP